MNVLLQKIVEAHGGMARWRAHEFMRLRVSGGGGLFPLKGRPSTAAERELTIWLHNPRVVISPYGGLDQAAVFTPARVLVEKLGGEIVTERVSPREAFEGHQLMTPWDPLHQAYFSGYALWTYLTSPFVLLNESVVITEIEPWDAEGETWRVLRACFPRDFPSHSTVQDFYFGEDLLLRRHDYSVDVLGGFPAAQLVSDYVSVNGISLPARRRAYPRGTDRQPILDMLMVAMKFSDISFV